MFETGQMVRCWNNGQAQIGEVLAFRRVIRTMAGPVNTYQVRVGDKVQIRTEDELVAIIEVTTRKPALEHEVPESHYEGVTAKRKRSRRRHKVTISAVTKRDARRSREAIRALLYPFGKEA